MNEHLATPMELERLAAGVSRLEQALARLPSLEAAGTTHDAAAERDLAQTSDSQPVGVAGTNASAGGLEYLLERALGAAASRLPSVADGGQRDAANAVIGVKANHEVEPTQRTGASNFEQDERSEGASQRSFDELARLLQRTSDESRPEAARQIELAERQLRELQAIKEKLSLPSGPAVFASGTQPGY